MGFADTYHEEIIASRRDRSRRAFFWAKVTSILLMLTIGVTLRADPELRRVIMTAGMDVVAGVADIESAPQPVRQETEHALPHAVTVQAPGGNLPRSRVKVNRPGGSLTTGSDMRLPEEVTEVLQQIRAMQTQP